MATDILISVLMPVYNGERFLRDSINSILRQTHTCLELVVVDDGSEDNTSRILHSIKDSRIRIRRHSVNQGVVATRRHALSLARGKYAAWVDADDISCPDRLRMQLEFLENHSHVGIIGSAYYLIDERGTIRGRPSLPCNSIELRWVSLLTNPFATSAVMLRRELIHKHCLDFDSDLSATQDYDFWMNILKHSQGANLPAPLIKYRVHRNTITGKHRQTQLHNHDRIINDNIRHVLPHFPMNLSIASQLRAILIGGKPSGGSFHQTPHDLAGIYLDLFNAFIKAHPSDSYSKCYRNVAWNLAFKFAKPRYRIASLKLLGKALNMYPGLPWKVIRRVLGLSLDDLGQVRNRLA